MVPGDARERQDEGRVAPQALGEARAEDVADVLEELRDVARLGRKKKGETLANFLKRS